MRILATTATLAVATKTDLSISTPHIDNYLSNKNHDRAEVQKEIQKLGLFQEQVTAKMQEMGLDRSKLDKVGSSEKAKSEWHSDLKKLKQQADHKRRHMKHSEAIDTLAGKNLLSKQMTQDLHSLILKKDAIRSGVEVGESEKAKFVRAMVTLNDMYISIDDERIQTLTDCTVTLFDMYRKLYFSYDTLRDLEGMHNARASDFSEAESSYTKADGDQKAQEDILTAKKQEHAARMGELREDLIKKVADRTLYRFIIDKVSGRCGETAGENDGADFDPAAAAAEKKKAGEGEAEGEQKLLFTQMTVEQKATCHKVCEAAANDPVKRNKAMLDIFSDPSIENEAERSLSLHAQMSMQETIKNLRAAEAEDVHPKYQKGTSFLQKSGPEPWNLSDQAACGCGSMEDAGCPALLTLIGQELECAKQLVREQEAKMTEQAGMDRDELDEINGLITKHKEAKDMFKSLGGHAKSEMDTFKEKAGILMTKTWEEWDETEVERTKCYLRLAELEANSFCAIKHIREFMRGLALEALGLTDDEVQDCKYADFMRESGECKDRNGNEVKCMKDEDQLNDIDNHPTMEWTRDRLKPRFQSPSVEEKIGSNATLAMACPNTISMPQRCNTFLCPLDCLISAFPKDAECTAKCGGGFSSKKAKIIQFARNGGNTCPDTKIVDECNTQACDVDCELHQVFEETGACLQACTFPGEKRIMLERKHVAVKAVGKGTCPEVNHEDRVREKECKAQQCVGDEYCTDTMDLVVVYECSSSVTSLGCWFMAQFVVALLERASAMTFGWPAMKVGLVRFGNGVSVPVVNEEGGTTGEYYVQDAHMVSALRNDVQALTGDIYNDFFQFVWSASSTDANGKVTRTLGYNNMGQALDKAADILDQSDRATDGDVKAMQKVLVLTKGKRTQCTIAKETAEKMKMKGIIIDMVLMSADYESSPQPYDILKEIVSYPSHIHFHVVNGLHTLVSWQSTSEAVSRVLPTVCPDAVSPDHAIKKMCAQKALLLHKGRECGDWTFHLSKKVVSSPEECANLALAAGYRSFVFTDVEHPNYQAKEGSTTANCVTHKTQGKLAAFDPNTLKPYDDTCQFVPEYGMKDPKSFTGWAKQPLAAGNGQITNHYAALDGSANCPKTWDAKYKKAVFAPGFNELEYFAESGAGSANQAAATTDAGEGGETAEGEA